nr:MAG TPA: hypothetical protein [Caudoviricetes sp.]
MEILFGDTNTILERDIAVVFLYARFSILPSNIAPKVSSLRGAPLLITIK